MFGEGGVAVSSCLEVGVEDVPVWRWELWIWSCYEWREKNGAVCVPIRDMSSFQRVVCTGLREVSLFWRVVCTGFNGVGT